MRGSPEVRNEFAKSLPQEILSELVVAMADLPASPPPTIAPQPFSHHANVPSRQAAYESPYGQPPPAKRARKSENAADILNGSEVLDVKPKLKKHHRKSEPVSRKPLKSRATNNSASSSSGTAPAPQNIDPGADLAYSRDLITRMLSGPGFWTRLVGPFKEPVDPVTHNAPNYFDVVKHPMDLKQIKDKMDRNEYSTSAEFEADIRLIFQNCYEYWTQNDQVFRECEKFEEYFNDKWSTRSKWCAQNVKIETLD